VIRHDKREVFSFSSLQSEFAKNSGLHINGQEIKSDTIVYQEGNIFYTKSNAVLKILFEIGGAWKLFYIAIIIPKPWRDWLYDVIARNRYRVFGKMDQCMVPSEELKRRFLV
jgi:predicted DCC family thiol-disulfide oxidoreductase YuxK